MDVSSIPAIPASLPRGGASADSSQKNALGAPHSAVVKLADGYRAYVVPSPPGLSAGGSSEAEAESNLGMILDLRA